MRAYGYAGDFHQVSYQIQSDGKIALIKDAYAGLAGWLKEKHLQDAYMYRYGMDTYLTQEYDKEPDFFAANGEELWPFKYVER